MFLVSCSVDSDGDPSLNNSYFLTGPGYKFTVDATRYQRMDFARNEASACQVDYEIAGIKRTGSELTLTISRPKGCNGIYELVWNGSWQESSPRRMQLYLTAQFGACTSGSERELDVIKVDLAAATGHHSSDLFTIYLREHCSVRDFNCMGNCDLSV